MINRLKVLFEGLKWRGNIYVGVLLSLLLVMGLYSVSRIGFNWKEWGCETFAFLEMAMAPLIFRT